MFDREYEIHEWRKYLCRKGQLSNEEADELEDHLRSELQMLDGGNLTEEEAFIIAVKRIGLPEEVSREYRKNKTVDLWKQLLPSLQAPAERSAGRKEILLITVLAVIAGLTGKIPSFFSTDVFFGDLLFYFKDISFYFMPMIAAYFIWKRSLSLLYTGITALVFILTFIIVRFYPYETPFHTLILTAIHLPVFLWSVLVIPYSGGDWKNSRTRMNFIRFSGEVFIYTFLILCGGAVLVGFLSLIFTSIDVDITFLIEEYIVIFGGFAAPVAASYLSESKKSIIENIAPVLAKLFAPLFTLALISFLCVMLVLGKSPYYERDFLIGFDVMLILVLALVLYGISARDKAERAGAFDVLYSVLIIAALVIDGISLSAILFRLGTYGISPNKVAALGLNLLLFVNLSILVLHYLRFIGKKTSFDRVEVWQMGFLPVYSIWAAVVALGFPLIFGYT